MKQIHYILLFLFLLIGGNLYAQSDSIVSVSGEMGGNGSNVDFLNEAGGITLFPRLTHAGELLYYTPVVSTDSVPTATVGLFTATVYGNILFNGWCETVLEQGFQISTTSDFSTDTTAQVIPSTPYSDCTLPCSENIFSYTFTTLSPNTTYYVRAYATNSMGTAYGDKLTFSTDNYDGQPCPGTPTVTDIDGNTYNTVMIGEQCWMKENLRTTHFPDNTWIPIGDHMLPPNRYIPNNQEENVLAYGYMYDWRTVMNGAAPTRANPSGVQGICPTGWHVPSYEEWSQLVDYISGRSEYICGDTNINIAKALADSIGWNSCTDDCTVGNMPEYNNATGFSARPAGLDGSNFGEDAWFCSTTLTGGFYANCRVLRHNNTQLQRWQYLSDRGFSVRCVRNESNSAPSTPVVTTKFISNITTTSADCGGNVISDGGETIIACGICWNDSSNPTIDNNHTTDGNGLGSFTSSLTGLNISTVYYVRAYVTTNTGTTYGGEMSFKTVNIDGQPCPGAETVTDYDGNTYNTIQLEDQCWMKENLRTRSYSNGVPITQGNSSSSSTEAYWFYPDNNSSNETTYGLLYNWKAAMHNSSSSSSEPSGVRGICPRGWHLPSEDEWYHLKSNVIYKTEYECDNNGNYIAKAMASTTGWGYCETTCAPGNTPSDNNATGFGAPPAGHFDYGFGYTAAFWSTTESSSNGVTYYSLGYDDPYMNQNSGATIASVRCLRNSTDGSETTATIPTITTSSISGITTTTATCGGNVTADGGSSVTDRGVCWSTSQNPTFSNSHTTDGAGTGSFTSSLTGLTAGTTYYVRAYAINEEGIAYGNQVSFATTAPLQDSLPCPGTPTVTDYDGNVYSTVQIGTQCWMRQNLRTTHYADGTSISNGGTSTSSSSRRYFNYSTSGITLASRGYLYNWAAVMRGASSSNTNPSGVQGVCPTGWHVPSKAEFTQLTDYVSSQSQYVCGGNSTYIAKALAATSGWSGNGGSNACSVPVNQSSNNATGFTAVPAGILHYSSSSGSASFGLAGNDAIFWSSTKYDSSEAYNLGVDYFFLFANLKFNPTPTGYSVRCLKN